MKVTGTRWQVLPRVTDKVIAMSADERNEWFNRKVAEKHLNAADRVRLSNRMDKALTNGVRKVRACSVSNDPNFGHTICAKMSLPELNALQAAINAARPRAIEQEKIRLINELDAIQERLNLLD